MAKCWESVVEGFGAISKTPFGDLATATLMRVAQIKAVSRLLNTHDVSSDVTQTGTIDVSNGEFELATGATAGSRAFVQSRRIISYKEGQGAEIRFSARWPGAATPLSSGSEALIGAGDVEDGLFVGYMGPDFGYLRRRGGQREIRTLTITAGAAVAGNLTITLNSGTGIVVAVDIGDSIGRVVRKIAAADYATADGGWEAINAGNRVVFMAYGTDTRNGTYSIAVGATGVVGSFAQTVAAVAASDNFTPQSSFTEDTACAGYSDKTKGMPFKLSWQWLGYGAVRLYVEDRHTGEYKLVHIDKLAGTLTAPTLQNPDVPLSITASNDANSENVQIVSACMAAFIPGDAGIENDIRNTAESTKTIGTTETPMLTLRVKNVLNGITNRIRIGVDGVSVGSESTKVATFRFYRMEHDEDGLRGSPSFTDAHAHLFSAVEYDTASTGWDGGTIEQTIVIGGTGGENLIWEGKQTIELRPGDMLLVTGQVSSGAASILSVLVQWLEAF